MTMQVIQHIELGSANTTITFSSIPTSYTDLLLVTSLRASGVSGNSWVQYMLRLNGSTTGYSERVLYGAGSGSGASVSNTTQTGLVFQWIPDEGATSSTFGNASFYIPNAQSSAAKSVSVDSVTENNATSAIANISAGLWNNSAAITSISLIDLTTLGGFPSGSSVTLYGITAGSSGGVTVS